MKKSELRFLGYDEEGAYLVRYVPGIDKWEWVLYGEDPFDDACFEFPYSNWYRDQAKKLAAFLNDKGVKP